MTLTFSRPADIDRGDRFGNLVVVRPSRGKKQNGKRYRVKCDCGRRTWAKGSKLQSGKAKNCGRCTEEVHQ